MKMFLVILTLSAAVCCFSFNLRNKSEYKSLYDQSFTELKNSEKALLSNIRQADLSKTEDVEKIRNLIHKSRISLKASDFWFRYFEPLAYRKLNGPLAVEWETEVFEKFEAPYKRKGAGLILAEQALDESAINKEALSGLIQTSLDSLETFAADSITSQLNSFQHFFFANRLFLLNLSAIYTTGFECPDTSLVIPELISMVNSVKEIYAQYNQTFPEQKIGSEYLSAYYKMIDFIKNQPREFSLFDHYGLVRDYVNPLFQMNQKYISGNNILSVNFNDYALNNDATSLFDKSLFISQNTKGIFSLVEDPSLLLEVKKIGKLLFYDPILSANNKRSCASCHKPTEYFTDTSVATALTFDRQQHLLRNAPSLINSVYNHLSMLDGKHISLQGQAREVIQSHSEMASDEPELIKKVMSCQIYKTVLKKLLKYTPEEKSISLSHIVSAITYYYSDFSNYYAPFDEAMNRQATLSDETRRGFNIFMSKAQCATCHFVPHFNGVKPPYIGSEFEILGVPADTSYTKLSDDKGRYDVNPAEETLNAFRTGSIRNSSYTQPYMHNGVFKTLDQVIEFYDMGGGAGKKLSVPNQTLSSDPLNLSVTEKKELISFIRSLDEHIIFDHAPATLPSSSNKALNNRKIGGEY